MYNCQVTEDFLDEYGWRRLFRELHELRKCEIVMSTQSAVLRANAEAVRKKLDDCRCGMHVACQ